jgi:hypothetical protein
MSVSRFVGDVLAERMRREQEYETAMERYLAVKPRNVSGGRSYPSRADLHERSAVR